MIVFFGAKLTQVYANASDSRVRPSAEGESYPRAVAKRESDPEREGIERRHPDGRSRAEP